MSTIGVIVPVYNCEQYIDRCLESIVSQTYSNLSIIIINDGSTDSSLEKCEQWILRDSRISVIDKTNGGVSSARNTGIEKAIEEECDYLAFVDADDWIERNMYESMLRLLRDNEAELSMCCRTREFKGYSEVYGQYSIKIFTGGIHDIGRLSNVYDVNICVNKLYPIWCFKDGGARFPEDIKYGEDLCFVVDILSKVTKIVYTSAGYYHYFDNTSSASYSLDDKKLLDGIYAYKKLFDYQKNIKAKLQIPFDFLFGAYLRAYMQGAMKKKYVKMYRQFLLNNFSECIRHLKSVIFFVCPCLYVMLLKTFRR